MAPQRVKMEDLGSALQTWEEMVDRHNKKKTPRSEKWNLLTTTKSVQLSRWFGKIWNATGSSMRDDSRSTMVCELRFTREVASRAGPGDEPMDVDTLVKGKSCKQFFFQYRKIYVKMATRNE